MGYNASTTMAKHVIYGVCGLLSALAIAAAIYFDGDGAVSPLSLEEDRATTTLAALSGASRSAEELHEVLKVIDGDTITARIAGRSETVRLIGIDAPETGSNGECFAEEATKALVAILGARVALESDPTQGERDTYGRLLAYAFAESGVNAAEALIEGGFAREYTYKNAYKYQKEFKAAEAAAKTAGKGLWASGACDAVAPAAAPIQTAGSSMPVPTYNKPAEGGKVTEEEKSQSVSEQTQKEEGERHEPAMTDDTSYTCSTNAYNCSDFATQAEAQVVFEQCGGMSNDIHRLDANKDGEACESLP